MIQTKEYILESISRDYLLELKHALELAKIEMSLSTSVEESYTALRTKVEHLRIKVSLLTHTLESIGVKE